MFTSSQVLIFLTLLFLNSAHPLDVTSRQTGAWSSCSQVRGTCVDTSTYSCSVPTLTGLCPGASNILCCPAPAGIKAGSCDSESLGLCKLTSLCSSSVIPGKCPGPASITCCPQSQTKPSVPQGDVASETDCSLYEKIEERGNRICTDRCREFKIENGWTRSYLGNAFCACDVTPKDQQSARTVRSCLQSRLLAASRGGKTMWTRREVRCFLSEYFFSMVFLRTQSRP